MSECSCHCHVPREIGSRKPSAAGDCCWEIHYNAAWQERDRWKQMHSAASDKLAIAELQISEATAKERQRCIDIVLSVWSAVPEDHGPWKRCKNAIAKDIRKIEDTEKRI